MNHSNSPQQKKGFNKYAIQTYKMPMNNLALHFPNQLQSDQCKKLKTERYPGRRDYNNKANLKQVLISNSNNKLNFQKQSIPQEADKVQIVMSRLNCNYSEKNNLYQNYSLTSDQIIKEQKQKLEEFDSLIRLQEFKIGRLQSELQMSKNQYQRLMQKYMQNDNKLHFYPLIYQAPQQIQTLNQINKSSLQRSSNGLLGNQVESMPSLTKFLNGDLDKGKKILKSVLMLKRMNSELKQEVQQKFKEVVQSVSEFMNQMVTQVQNIYIQHIESLEEVMQFNNKFNEMEMSRIQMKAEILNREIANVDNMKEVLYDKILTLIK